MESDGTLCVPSTSQKQPSDDAQFQFDMAVLVHQWLNVGPFKEVASFLKEEIAKKLKCPPRTDHLGQNHDRTLEDYINTVKSDLDQYPPMLSTVVKRIHQLANLDVPPPIPAGLRFSVFNNPRNSIVRTRDVLSRKDVSTRIILAKAIPRYIHSQKMLLDGRELGRRISNNRLPGSNAVETLDRHFRIMGHMTNAYCVSFDRTGRFILTGADDNLVKVWDSSTGYLKFSFRGHKNEVSDICVSLCNQMVAAGSVDKTVHVWSLQNGALLRVFKNHTASVVRVAFLPFVVSADGEQNRSRKRRFLVSCGYDCLVVFMAYDEDHLTFEPYDICIFEERDSPGSRMISLCYSPCGQIIACGDSRSNVKLFRISPQGAVSKIQEIFMAHSEKVDSLNWANRSLRFASGSPDGIAKVWTFDSGKWKPVSLQLENEELEDFQMQQSRNTAAVDYRSKKAKYKVTMLCWTLDDRFVVTAGSDRILRAWNPKTGHLHAKMKFHTEEVYVLKGHPVCPELVISCGHDGAVAIWNLSKGTDAPVWKFVNTMESRGHVALFDMDIREDGSAIAVIDAHGQLSLFSLGENLPAKKAPKQQFFTTDYDTLNHDDDGLAFDANTGLPPHLMPPPLLRNADEILFEPEFQRRVPGREHLKAEDLMTIPLRTEDSVWTTRVICPKLPSGELENWHVAMLERCRDEYDDYEREQRRVVEIVDEEPIVVANDLQSRGANARARTRIAAAAGYAGLRERRRVADRAITLDAAIAEQDARRAQALMEGYRSSDDDPYTETSNSEDEETDSSTDSDFSLGRRAERARRDEAARESQEQVITTSSGRRVQRRRLQEEVETRSPQRNRTTRRRAYLGDESPNSQDEVTSSSTIRRNGPATRRLGVDEAQQHEDNDEEPQPGPSSQPVVQQQQRPKKRKGGAAAFPQWMTMTKPRRFPYFAQLSDRVVYFRQGHEIYLEAVNNRRLYNVSSRMWPSEDRCAEEFCIVEEVRYTRRPYRLTCLRLTRLDSAGEPTANSWTVKFHDLENAPDFIVPLKLYEKSKALILEDGMDIEAIIDGKWWTGTVESIGPSSEIYPDSNWCSVKVRWDAGQDDVLSPWDLQARQPGRRSETIATEEDELTFANFGCYEDDWPAVGHDRSMSAERLRQFHSERLMRALAELGSMETAEVFNTPVSVEAFPDYPEGIDYPIDLSTIRERLNHCFYRSMSAFHCDVRGLAIAAEQFNERNSQIVENARMVVEAIVRFSRDQTIESIADLYTALFNEPAENIVEYRWRNIDRISREQLAAVIEANGTGSTAAARPGWVDEAAGIIRHLMTETTAQFFISAANATEDDLHQVLAGSTDLMKMLSRLEDHMAYDAPRALMNEFDFMIRSVREHFDDHRSTIYKAAVTFNNLFTSRMRQLADNYERTMCSIARDVSRMQLRSNGVRKAAARPERVHHAYRTRRADALSSQGLFVAASSDQQDSEPAFSLRERKRNAAANAGFYQQLANGRSEEHEEVSRNRRATAEPPSSSSTQLTSNRTRRAGGAPLHSTNEESVSSTQSSSSTSASRQMRAANKNSQTNVELFDAGSDEEGQHRTNGTQRNKRSGEVEERVDELSDSSEAESSDEDAVVSPIADDDEDDDDDEVQEDASESSDYSEVRPVKTNRKTVKRQPTRKSSRKRKRPRMSSDDDDDDDDEKVKPSAKRRTTRATGSRVNYALSDDDDDDYVATTSTRRRRR